MCGSPADPTLRLALSLQCWGWKSFKPAWFVIRFMSLLKDKYWTSVYNRCVSLIMIVWDLLRPHEISRDLPEFCICQPANHNTILEMLAHLKMRWSGRHDNDEINDDKPCNTLPCSHGRKVFLLLLFVAVVGEVGHHNGWVQTHSRGSNEAVQGKPSASATGLWNFAHSRVYL